MTLGAQRQPQGLPPSHRSTGHRLFPTDGPTTTEIALAAGVNPPPDELSNAARQPRHPELPSQRFHGLLNSLFKVLFTFPSRYLSAIGLAPVFSLGWSLPPTLGCIPKQPDSTRTDPRPAANDLYALRGSHPLWRAVPSQLRARMRWIGTVCLSRPQFARP